MISCRLGDDAVGGGASREWDAIGIEYAQTTDTDEQPRFGYGGRNSTTLDAFPLLQFVPANARCTTEYNDSNSLQASASCNDGQLHPELYGPFVAIGSHGSSGHSYISPLDFEMQRPSETTKQLSAEVAVVHWM